MRDISSSMSSERECLVKLLGLSAGDGLKLLSRDVRGVCEL